MKFWVGFLLAGLLGSGTLLAAQSSTETAVSAAQALNVAGQDTPTPAKPPEAGQPQPTQGSIQDIEPRVGVGDLIKVSVMGAPEYDQEVRVGGSGDVHLQLVGSVHIGGLTTTEAEQAVRTKLIQGGYFADPQVSIFEKEYATQGVSVFGEVHRPGVYPVTGPRRLFDMLSIAGGTTPTAGQTVSITHREHPQSAQTVTMSRDPAQNVVANVEILPGDTVLVSRAGVVYVVGAVKKPTSIVMENSGNISVLQAIAMAEGTGPTASLNGAKIIRRTKSDPQEIHLDLKKILSSKSPDVRLQAEDIVFVPNSKGKMAGNVALESIVRTAVNLASYSIFF